MRKYQINKITGSKTAKVLAIVLSIFFIIPFLLMFLPVLITNEYMAIFPLLLLPVIYFIMVYLFIRLFAFIYNKVAIKYGGIEIEINELEDNIK